MLVLHGSGKVFGGMEKFIAGVAKMDFPFPEVTGHLAAWSEFGGGILLLLGLGTRPAAILAGATMAVAGFVRLADEPFARQELAITYLVSLVVLLIVGGGKFSADWFVYRWYRGRNSTTTTPSNTTP